MRRKNKIFASLLMATTFLTSAVACAKPKENFTNVVSFDDSFTADQGTWANIITNKYGFNFTSDVNYFFPGTTAGLADSLAAYQAVNPKTDPNALYLVYMGPALPRSS